MDHLSFPTATIGLKEIVIGSAKLSNELVVKSNQESAYIDRHGHSDGGFPFGSHKNGNKTSVDFGRTSDGRIGMNPSRTIEIPLPQITRTSLSNCDMLKLFRKGFPLNGTMTSEGENLVVNLRGNKISKRSELENHFEVE